MRPARYYVSMIPDGSHPDWAHFAVTVAYRGRGLYAVYAGAFESHSLPTAADGLGRWDYEGSEEREDEAWLATHRFRLADALILAKKLAPTIGIYSHRDRKLIRAADLLEEQS